MVFQPRPKFTPGHISRANASPSVARYHHCVALVRAAATLLQGNEAITTVRLHDVAEIQRAQLLARAPQTAGLPLPLVAITPDLLREAARHAQAPERHGFNPQAGAALAALAARLSGNAVSQNATTPASNTNEPEA